MPMLSQKGFTRKANRSGSTESIEDFIADLADRRVVEIFLRLREAWVSGLAQSRPDRWAVSKRAPHDGRLQTSNEKTRSGSPPGPNTRTALPI
jgi:hypothetical protein